MWVAASTRLGAWMEQSAECKAAYECHTWFFSSRCAFAVAIIHDIRLQILQPLNLGLHQWLSREFPGLQSWDEAAPHFKFALNLLASHAEWLAGSQAGLLASEHGSFLIKYTSHWFCSLGKHSVTQWAELGHLRKYISPAENIQAVLWRKAGKMVYHWAWSCKI